ncbi:MAG TPA: hypothetical protein PKJ83_10625 [Cyclobacteriaceae bacterium]|nr:hypothetical protein [Cyclobacteriaceae bacterium]HPW62341.1 hypothetical protein [Cyclobacteriaceae bacterium]
MKKHCLTKIGLGGTITNLILAELMGEKCNALGYFLQVGQEDQPGREVAGAACLIKKTNMGEKMN